MGIKGIFKGLKTQELWVLALFLAIRIGFALPALFNPSISKDVNADCAQYLSLAQNLVHHGSFCISQFSGCPDGLRTPVYPLFLAISYVLAGNTNLLTVLTQCLIWALVGLWVYRRSQSKALGLLTGFLVILSPLSIKYQVALMTENLAVGFLVLTLIIFEKAIKEKRMILFSLAGLIAGLAALTRPGLLVLGPVMILFLGRPFIKRLAGFVLAWGAIVGVWVLRNAAVFGFPFFSSVVYVNNIYYHTPRVIAWSKAISLDSAKALVQQELSQEFGFKEDITLEPRKLVKANQWAIKTMMQYPGSLLVLWVRGTGLCLAPSHPASVCQALGLGGKGQQIEELNQSLLGKGQGIKEMFSSPSMALVLAWSLVQLSLLYGLFLLGLYRAIRSSQVDKRVLLLLLSLMVILLIMPGTVGSPRFRLLAEPLIAAAAGLSMGWSTKNKTSPEFPGPN